MAHKTFISYKYSESQELRDRIIKAFGTDAKYYLGETSSSPDLTDTKTDNIKKNLKDMIYGTSVTIIIISPNMTDSEWINWEIEYSLKEITREDKVSRTNGIVGIIMKYNGGYSWIEKNTINSDGCSSRTIDITKLYEIISKNRFNQKNKEYLCGECKTVDRLLGSYISLINEDDFLLSPNKYIENAFDKSKKIDNYKICKIN
ncbi:TIR domain-containing protein [Lysinibacillus fusiformis]|uniref:TIR domain-containing protein n=1 Tax=Lysinibacillus fusiformis TaxID=28031 RepID=UPI001EF519E7|nr:TIR domain-containing protein [Lysinibacillus fusiformis]MCG7435585.1 TIR domain-containing protein [Lysinibacillus fusiformis]